MNQLMLSNRAARPGDGGASSSRSLRPRARSMARAGSFRGQLLYARGFDDSRQSRTRLRERHRATATDIVYDARGYYTDRVINTILQGERGKKTIPFPQGLLLVVFVSSR